MSNVSRAMQIIELLADAPEGVRVTDVATHLGVNRAIPFRLLSELVALGYAIQDPESERYRATFALGSVGLRQLESSGVVEWSQDEISRLALASGELVRVAMATQHRLNFVAQAQGASSSLIVHSPLRAELALHATASGKAYLSTLSDEDITELVTQRGLERFTERTITELDDLLEHLAQVRMQGYAIVTEEMEPGVNAVAAPIVPGDGTGPAVGTVIIAGPSVRLTLERIADVTDLLLETTARLGRQWNVFTYLNAPLKGGGESMLLSVLDSE